jgi:Flp pilus assembly protein TadG
MRIARLIRTVLSRCYRSRRGNVAVISALALPCIVGFCGLGADTGYWYYRQRVLQGAADITAYNAGVALSAGSSKATIVAGATTDATTNGWNSAQGTITVNIPPTTGNHQNANSAEVILTENESRFFSLIYSNSKVNISVRAVAEYKSSGIACMLALDKSAQNALSFSGSNSTKLVGCNAMSDSLNNQSLGVNGSATVSVPCAISAGGVDVGGTLTLTQCKSAITDAEPAADPYASLAAPAIPAGCTNPPANGNLSPGKYCGGLSIKDARTLNPGVYVISGGTFMLNANANITGTGVMFYLTNGATLKFNGNAQMNLSAATAGTYAGILFYSDRTQANVTQTFNGTDSSVFTGALYFPSQSVTVNGNYTGANGCMQLVADTISYSGSSTLSATCPGTGLSGIPVPSGSYLVE